jgi:hypothetical protein
VVKKGKQIKREKYVKKGKLKIIGVLNEKRCRSFLLGFFKSG